MFPPERFLPDAKGSLEKRLSLVNIKLFFIPIQAPQVRQRHSKVASLRSSRCLKNIDGLFIEPFCLRVFPCAFGRPSELVEH